MGITLEGSEPTGSETIRSRHACQLHRILTLFQLEVAVVEFLRGRGLQIPVTRYCMVDMSSSYRWRQATSAFDDVVFG